MTQTERERQATKAAVKRAAERDLSVHTTKDPNRRAACEADDCEWLRRYVPGVFRFPFTDDQRHIVEEISHALQYGLLKTFAAPRHDGKTSIARYLCLKYSLQKIERDGLLVPFVPLSLLINATGKKAGDSLDAIKNKLRSAREGSPLFDDYGLECIIARHVAPAPARAHNVTVGGRPVFLEWAADHIILPSFDDEGGMAGMLAGMGITSNDIQGFNLYDVRPRFCLLDDLDDRDSLSSKDGGTIAAKIEKTVDENISGLGGPGEPFGAVMLCTIPSRHSVAFKYSDPKQKQWSGVRLRKIKEWPANQSLWDEYMGLRRAGRETFDDDGRPIDKHGRKAHQFLLERFDEMHLGAVVSNENDYTRSILPDGSQMQVSALQNCYDFITDHGMPSFLTEYQNDPPEDDGRIESGINPQMIQKQKSGYANKTIPPGCTVLSHGCDVGKTKGFHWVVRAFKPDGTGYTIDYGIMDVAGVKHGSNEGLNRAIYNAVRRREEEFRAAEYLQANGEPLSQIVSVFDSRYESDAVMMAVKSLGMGVYAIKGIGQSAGASTKGKFRPCIARTTNRKPGGGERWYFDRDNPVGIWAVHADTDYWKAWEHARWMTATDKPGCMFIWGDDDTPLTQHEQYAKHICAEIEVEEEYKGVVRRVFIPKAREMDWLDASYYSDVGAALNGIRVLGAAKSSRPPPDQRQTARDMAKASGR
jgi:hypothetical protein